jgi:hypothetical protein
MDLSGQIDSPVIFKSAEIDIAEFLSFRRTTIRSHPCPIKWISADGFQKIDCPESADCGKSL